MQKTTIDSILCVSLICNSYLRDNITFHEALKTFEEMYNELREIIYSSNNNKLKEAFERFIAVLHLIKNNHIFKFKDEILKKRLKEYGENLLNSLVIFLSSMAKSLH